MKSIGETALLTTPEYRKSIPAEQIESSILLIRGEKVILDEDLAFLYGVSTKVLVQAVKRHRERFPADFMFQLNKEEFASLRSQIVTSNRKKERGGRRYPPYAFTEEGVAMLSSVLNSPRAIKVNIEIMRAFVRLRQMLASHAGLARKLEELEKKYDSQFKIIFEAIRQLMAPKETPGKKIGFQLREKRAAYSARKQVLFGIMKER
jgi:DNA-binding PadR family transcriptional regulator